MSNNVHVKRRHKYFGKPFRSFAFQLAQLGPGLAAWLAPERPANRAAPYHALCQRPLARVQVFTPLHHALPTSYDTCAERNPS
jgi:hypothetical protein